MYFLIRVPSVLTDTASTQELVFFSLSLPVWLVVFTRELLLIISSSAAGKENSDDFLLHVPGWMTLPLVFNDNNVNKICQRMYPNFGLLNRISSFLPTVCLLRIYKHTILPILDYGSIVWHECGSIETKPVEKLQNRAMRIIRHQGRRKSTQEMGNELKLLTLNSRRRFLRFLKCCTTWTPLTN